VRSCKGVEFADDMVVKVAECLLLGTMNTVLGFAGNHVLQYLGLSICQQTKNKDIFKEKLNDAVFRVLLTDMLGLPIHESRFGAGMDKKPRGGGGGSIFETTLGDRHVAIKVPHPQDMTLVNSTNAHQQMALYEVRLLQHFADDPDFVCVLGCCNVSWTDPAGKNSFVKRLGFVMEHLQFTLGGLVRSPLFHAQRHTALDRASHGLLLELLIVKAAEFLLRVIPKMHAAGFAHGDFSSGNVCVVFLDKAGINIRTVPWKDIRTVQGVTANDIAFKVIDPGMGGRDRPEGIGTPFTKVTDSFPIVPYGPMKMNSGSCQNFSTQAVRGEHTFTRLTDWHQALMLLALMLVNAGLDGDKRLSMADDGFKEKVKAVLRGLGQNWCKRRETRPIGWLDLLMNHDCRSCHPNAVVEELCTPLRSWQGNRRIIELGEKFMEKIEVELGETKRARMKPASPASKSEVPKVSINRKRSRGHVYLAATRNKYDRY